MRLLWLALAGLMAGCAGSPPAPPSPPPPSHYVGAQTCAPCHQQQVTDWKGSHHDAAMQPATASTVLGNFDNQTFTHGGVTSKFYRKGDQYWVNTDGPDGKMRDYAVQYTFGVYPLQQYLLPLDKGRLQALNVAWDCRPKEQGGQRWFHLYPQDKMDHTDILHWTGLYQNWNYMCADCHSTGVNKGYANGSFNTTWTEVNVACETCHGPASSHLDWAKPKPAERPNWTNKGLTRNLGRGSHWTQQTATQPALRGGGTQAEQFLDSCAQCHARRSSLTQQAEGLHFLDDYRPTNLEAPNYEADGQIREEVYEHGAFLQSKMHAWGVTCRDCHDSHSLKLKAPGNALCLQCHLGERYDTPNHTHHKADGPGASCVACHMPTHTYMVVHDRHDHSFRVPRPDLTVALGVPNACAPCHKDHPASWAAAAIEGWYGQPRKGFQTYGPAFSAAREGRPEAGSLLVQLARDGTVPGLARATALAELTPYLQPDSLAIVEKSLADPDANVRLGALQALEPLPLDERWKRAEALLKDPLRAVRLQAVRLLGAAPEAELGEKRNQSLRPGLQEWEAYIQANADRPEPHLQMGVFHAQRGEFAKAEQEYKAAIQVEPRLPHSYVNLADLYRSLNREGEGEKVLRQALKVDPSNAAVHHALGLTLVRRHQSARAIAELEKAARLAPENPQFGYVLAVALDSQGRREQALAQAGRVLKVRPYHTDTLLLATRLAAMLGKTEEAQGYGARLQELAKTDPRLRAMLRPAKP